MESREYRGASQSPGRQTESKTRSSAPEVVVFAFRLLPGNLPALLSTLSREWRVESREGPPRAPGGKRRAKQAAQHLKWSFLLSVCFPGASRLYSLLSRKWRAENTEGPPRAPGGKRRAKHAAQHLKWSFLLSVCFPGTSRLYSLLSPESGE